MTKKFLSMLLAIAMVVSMFAGLATTASAAGYAKATSIAVGDQVVLVCENALMEMTGISTTKTKYGIGTAYSGAPAGTMVFEVVAGASEGRLVCGERGSACAGFGLRHGGSKVSSVRLAAHLAQ